MSKHYRMILLAVAVVVVTLLVMWVLSQAPPRCDDGKVPVVGEDRWYCVEGTEAPRRAGGELRKKYS